MLYKEVRKADGAVTGIYDAPQIDNENYRYEEISEEEAESIKALWAANAPEPEPEPPDIQTDLMALAIDHEYRLALLELGVI